MKKILFAIGLALVIVLNYSCDELLGTVEENVDPLLTQDEVIKGLKRALEIGADTAVSVTSKTDGFFKDELIKIILPPEANAILKHKDNALLQAIGIDNMINDVILRINRAAEKAASGSKDIFVDAITGMSIAEGASILYGTNPLDSSADESIFDSTAATNFLISTTYEKLINLFSPIMNAALDEPLVAGISTNQAWNTLQTGYNTVAESPANFLLNWEPVNINLAEYAIGKGLDGLFVKVKDEEKKIRKNPLDWVEDIIQKIFGYVKDNPDGKSKLTFN